MHEVAPGGVFSASSSALEGTTSGRYEGRFREILSAQLASLEEVLVCAHLSALASVHEQPDPPTDAWGPAPKATAPQNDPRPLFHESEGSQRTHSQGTTSSHKFACVMPEVVQQGTSVGLSTSTTSVPKPFEQRSTLERSLAAISAPESYVSDQSRRPSLDMGATSVPGTILAVHAAQSDPRDVRFNGSTNFAAGGSSSGPCPIMNQSDSLRAEKAQYVVRSGRFELLALWKEKRDNRAGRTKKNLTRNASIHWNNEDSNSASLQEQDDDYIDAMEESEKFMLDHPHLIESDSCLRHYLFLPNTMKRASWDILSLLMVSYDVVILPLGFFDIPELLFFEVMTWVTRLFWTFDIPMSLITGYLRLDGTIEMRPKRILQRYVSTWLVMDMVIVLTDWFELISSGFGFARVAKASRTFRIIRMIRLVRVAKVTAIIGHLVERVQSEVFQTVAEILQIMCILVVVAHLVACVWWGIGSRDFVDTWVEAAGARRISFAAQYAKSLHWSITQFTGGMDEIIAQNVTERYFVIGVFLFCFILASLFLSSLTSSMTQLTINLHKQSRQTQKLRRFLHQNNISGRTALRIQRNAQHAIAEQQRLMPEQEVELLSLVSEPLRYELHFEMYSEVFDSHIFFGRYKEENTTVVRKICHFASSVSLVSRGDIVFSAGELPENPRTYVFMEGYMNYLSIHGSAQHIHEQQWITEQALWTTWRHGGELTALADCRLYTLDAKGFGTIVSQFEHSVVDPRKYAQAYIKDLNRLETEELTDLTIHLMSPGAEKNLLKAYTDVYELCKNEYNMKLGFEERKANAFLYRPRVTLGGRLRFSAWQEESPDEVTSQS